MIKIVKCKTHYPKLPEYHIRSICPDLDIKTMYGSDFIFSEHDVCVYYWKNREGKDGPVSYEEHDKNMTRWFNQDHQYIDLTRQKSFEEWLKMTNEVATMLKQ